MGDFNCPQSHTVFNPLKSSGFAPILKNQKTSLRQKCISNDCLASEYDNLFYDTRKINIDNQLRIPMITGSRSLNLSNSVAITIYEALRQNSFNNLL